MLTEGNVGIIAVLASVVVTLANNFLYFGRKLEKLDRLEVDYKELKNDHKETLDELIALRTKFDICVPLKSPYADKNSPLVLTKKGKEISKAMQAHDLIARHEQELSKFIDVSKTKNAYDIQQEAFKIIAERFYELLDENEINLLKNEAYKTGDTIEAILFIFQIIFRDKLLKKYNLFIDDSV
jgi:hypothetical protein